LKRALIAFSLESTADPAQKEKAMKGNITLAALMLSAGLYAGTGIAAAQSQSPRTNSPSGYGQKSRASEETASRQTSPTAAETASDEKFVENAASGGMAEVRLGQLAEDKAQSPAVKNFAKRMVADHGKANNELKETASKENITLPASESARDRATYERLSKLSGAAFDRAYAREMVTDHTKDVSEFQREARSGKNGALKNFASSKTPVLEDHLKMAQEMQKQVEQSKG
jgi:putative membrane protein